jgi:hypothetical protein
MPNHHDLLNPDRPVSFYRKSGPMRAAPMKPRPGSIAALLVKDDFVLMTADKDPRRRGTRFAGLQMARRAQGLQAKRGM